MWSTSFVAAFVDDPRLRSGPGHKGVEVRAVLGQSLDAVTNDIPDPAEISGDLRKVARAGWRPARWTDCEVLLGLSIVGAPAGSSRPLDRAMSLRDVLLEAVGHLGEGPSGEAVRLLLGIDARSRGLLLKNRRDLAASAIGIEAETFRKGWEAELLGELAEEIYQLENERRIPIRVKGRKRDGPVFDDLRYGTQGKPLDRREAEARLLATMYELRADLLAVAQASEPRTSQIESTVRKQQALWCYARFVDQMARFVDNYGSALVLAGNEVTAREATSLLGWRPPLDDGDLTCLRLAVADVSSSRDIPVFLAHLASSDRGSAIIESWMTWLAYTSDAQPRS
jgi:hypothetical protein